MREMERERETAAPGCRPLWGGSSFIRAVQSSHYSPVTILSVPDQLNGKTDFRPFATPLQFRTCTAAQSLIIRMYVCHRM